MGRMLKLFNFALCVAVLSKAAHCTENNYPAVAGLNVMHIYKNTAINTPDIYMHESVYIANRGVINGNIHICDGCSAYIQNSGAINGKLFLGNNAELVRIIRFNSDITALDASYPHSIIISNADNICWGDITAISDGADKIIIKDSVLYVSPAQPVLLSTPSASAIELVGENEIRINSHEIFDGMRLLSNVSGDGSLRVRISDTDALHAAVLSVQGGDVYLNMVRETDYYKILKNNTGRFLNGIRAKHSGDRLVAKVDSATDMEQVNHVLHKSMRLNPRRMMAPVHSFMHHMYNTVSFPASNSRNDVSMRPFAIFANNMNAYGLNTDVGVSISDRLSAGLIATSAILNFSDTIDDMSANIYGAGLFAAYATNKLSANARIGKNYVAFDSPDILLNGKTVSHMNAAVSYAGVDGGPKFNITDKFLFNPSIGMYTEYYDADTGKEQIIAATAGAVLDYRQEGVDVSYDYKVKLSCDTKSIFNTALGVEIFSAADDMGGSVMFGILKDDYGVSYSLSVALKIVF